MLLLLFQYNVSYSLDHTEDNAPSKRKLSEVTFDNTDAPLHSKKEKVG
jgi:hypothetical protein